MKVLQICSYYPTNKLYKHLFEKQEELGVENLVFVPVGSEGVLDKYPLKLKRSRLFYTKCFNKFDKFNFFYKQIKIWQELDDNVNIKEFDLVHAHTLFTNGNLALKIKKKFSKKYIVAVRNTDINVFFKYFFWLRLLGIKIIKEAEKIILISPVYREKLLAYIPENIKKEIEDKIEIIPNGMDDFWFENKPNLEKKEKKQLLFIGRLDKNKRIIETIKSVVDLNNQGYNLSLNIVGDGPLQKIVKQHSEKEDCIRYRGRITDLEELRKEYERANIFIMPSKTETFGIVYLEALSQGCKVIYTEGEGISGLNLAGSFSINNIDNLDKKIINNLDSLVTSLGNLANFKWGRIANNYFKIYKDSVKL